MDSSVSDDAKFEFLIVGAGVVGCAVARALALHGVQSVCVAEARQFPLCGASKGNSAMIHSGFDCVPGTLEASLVKRGHALFEAFAEARAHLPFSEFPFRKIGALMLAYTEAEQSQILTEVVPRAAQCRVSVQLLMREEVLALEPHVSADGLRIGLLIASEWCVDPWRIPLLILHEAIATGAVRLLCGHRVARAEWDATAALHHLHFVVSTRRCSGGRAAAAASKVISAKWVINAAGLQCSDVEALLGRPFTAAAPPFAVFPRLGRFIAFRGVIGTPTRIILPVPTKKTKGVIVFPTVWGADNDLVIGPTAEDPDEQRVPQSSVVEQLRQFGERRVPGLRAHRSAAPSFEYSGSRPALVQRHDYFLACAPDVQRVVLAGVRSTGLTSSLALGEWTLQQLISCGAVLPEARWSDAQLKAIFARARAAARVAAARTPEQARHPISVAAISPRAKL